MVPDDILDGELSPSAPPSLLTVLKLLRAHIKARDAPRSPPWHTETDVDRALAVIRAKDAAARRKMRELSREGQVLRRAKADLQVQVRKLDDQLTMKLMEVDQGTRQAKERAEQLRVEVEEFRALVELSEKSHGACTSRETNEFDSDSPVDSVGFAGSDGSVGFDGSVGSADSVGPSSLSRDRAREENFLRYAFAAAASASHASIHSL